MCCTIWLGYFDHSRNHFSFNNSHPRVFASTVVQSRNTKNAEASRPMPFNSHHSPTHPRTQALRSLIDVGMSKKCTVRAAFASTSSWAKVQPTPYVVNMYIVHTTSISSKLKIRKQTLCNLLLTICATHSITISNFFPYSSFFLCFFSYSSSFNVI